MFNALKYIKNLEATGVPRNQAEAHAQFVLEAIEGEVATKADLTEFKSEMKTEMALLENRLLLKLGGLLLACMTLQTGILGLMLTFKFK